MRPRAARPDPAAPAALRVGLTALVALAEAAHLAWEHLHGGIVSHHLLNDPTLPAIWNGWGLVLLPALAWIASSRAFDRPGASCRLRRPFLARLLAAAAAGLTLSMAFASGREDLAGYVLTGLVLAAVSTRLYRIECLLGFVLGMAWTFGAILPTLIGGAIALVSALAWRALYPLVARAVSGARRFVHR